MSHKINSINTYGRHKRKIRLHFSTTLVYILMLLLVAFTALPLIYMISTAFKPLEELFVFPPRFFVQKPTMGNFSDLFTALSASTVPFSRYVFNSLLVTVVSVAATCIISSMCAYGISKHNPPGAGKIMSLIITALMFTTHVSQIPRFIIISSMGLLNTYSALILPLIAVPYNCFLMKQFIDQYPNELLEAGRMDGANEWTLFWRIVMPALKPAWATLIVFSFVSSWNDYFSPLVYTSSMTMKTLPLAVQTIGASSPGVPNYANAGAVAAATFLMTLPTIVIFTIMQKKVIKTMTYSGLKG